MNLKGPDMQEISGGAFLQTLLAGMLTCTQLHPIIDQSPPLFLFGVSVPDIDIMWCKKNIIIEIGGGCQLELHTIA